MRELLEVRRILETQAALLAGVRRTDDDITDLNRLVEILPELMNDPEEFVAVDIRFHIRLAEASANELLAAYLRDTMTNFIRRRTQYRWVTLAWNKHLIINETPLTRSWTVRRLGLVNRSIDTLAMPSSTSWATS